MRRLFTLAVLLALPAFAKADDVSIVVEKDGIDFKTGSTVVAKYATAASVAKPYLYPVLAPNGVGVTRNWPVAKGLPGEATTDHIHQKSVWFCHGDVIPEGIELKIKSANKGDKGVDFWSEAKDKDGTPRHGTIKCVKVGEPKQIAKNHVSIETQNEWITPDGVKIMDEVRVIHFIDLPEVRVRHHIEGERLPDHLRRHEGGFVWHPGSRRVAAQPENRGRRDNGRRQDRHSAQTGQPAHLGLPGGVDRLFGQN